MHVCHIHITHTYTPSSLTSSQYASVGCIVEVVPGVGVAHSGPRDARLVGPLPPRPVVDFAGCQEVVTTSE